MAEICWRAKNIFKDADFEKRTKQVEVEQEGQDHDELALLEDYEDSEDKYDYSEEFYMHKGSL